MGIPSKGRYYDMNTMRYNPALPPVFHPKKHALKEGVKYDSGKPRWDLLPLEQIEDVVKVLTSGSIKYSDDNWKKIDNIQDRYFAAALRHMTAQRGGERLDKETGLPHLSHAICCLLFMAWEEKNETRTR